MQKQGVRTGKQAYPADSWSAHHVPDANTAATATQAAPGVSKRNVITWLTVVFAAGSSAPAAVNTSVSAIDGGTGGTTYLWRATISLPATAGATNGIALEDLWLPGSTNTATTLEFLAAGGANTYESVSFGGVVVDE